MAYVHEVKFSKKTHQNETKKKVINSVPTT